MARYFGAEWENNLTRLRIWDADYHWNLTRKQARDFGDDILRCIGRFAEAMKPAPEPGLGGLHTSDPPNDRLAALERENAELVRVNGELWAENTRLVDLVRFLDQDRPRESAA